MRLLKLSLVSSVLVFALCACGVSPYDDDPLLKPPQLIEPTDEVDA